MRVRTFVILALLAALAVVVAINLQQPSEQSAVAGGVWLPALKDHLNEVSAIDVKGAGGSYRLVRDQSGWRVPDKAGYPADIGTLRKFLIDLSELERVEAKTSKPALYAKLNLQDPGAKDTKSIGYKLIGAGDKPLAEVIFGKNRVVPGETGQKEFYVRQAGDPQSWLVQGRLALHRKPTGWLSSALLTIDRNRIRDATIDQPDNPTVAVSRQAPAQNDFTLAGIPTGKKVKYPYSVNDIATTFASLTLDDVTRADKIVFGDGPHAVVETFDGLRVTMQAAGTGPGQWVRLHAEYDAALVASKKAAAGVGSANAVKKPATENATDSAKDGKAPDDNKPASAGAVHGAEAVKAEAGDLNRRWQGWVYKLASYQYDNITKPLGQLVQDDKPAATGATNTP